MREGQLQPWSKTPRWGRVGVGVDGGGVQEDSGKGSGNGHWTLARTGGCGGQVAGSHPDGCGQGWQQGRHSRSPAAPGQATWVQRASWPSLWSTLRLTPPPPPGPDAARLSTAACMSLSFPAYMRVHMQVSTCTPCLCVCVTQGVGVCVPMYTRLLHTRVQLTAVCPCTSTSEPSPAGSRRRPGPLQ